ncbi:MAG: hypothetical protein Q9218_007294 [Villophora microphyllina]
MGAGQAHQGYTSPPGDSTFNPNSFNASGQQGPEAAPGEENNTVPPPQAPLSPPKAPPYPFGPHIMTRSQPPPDPKDFDFIYRPSDPKPEPDEPDWHTEEGPVPRHEYIKLQEQLKTARIESLNHLRRTGEFERELADKVKSLQKDIIDAQIGRYQKAIPRPSNRVGAEIRKPTRVDDIVAKWQFRKGVRTRDYSVINEEPPIKEYYKDKTLYKDIPSKLRESTVNAWLTRARLADILHDWKAMESHSEQALKFAKGLEFEPLEAKCKFFKGIALYKQNKRKEYFKYVLAYEYIGQAERELGGYYVPRTEVGHWLERSGNALQSQASWPSNLSKSPPKDRVPADPTSVTIAEKVENVHASAKNNETSASDASTRSFLSAPEKEQSVQASQPTHAAAVGPSMAQSKHTRNGSSSSNAPTSYPRGSGFDPTLGRPNTPAAILLGTPTLPSTRSPIYHPLGRPPSPPPGEASSGLRSSLDNLQRHNIPSNLSEVVTSDSEMSPISELGLGEPRVPTDLWREVAEWTKREADDPVQDDEAKKIAKVAEQLAAASLVLDDNRRNRTERDEGAVTIQRDENAELAHEIRKLSEQMDRWRSQSDGSVMEEEHEADTEAEEENQGSEWSFQSLLHERGAYEWAAQEKEKRRENPLKVPLPSPASTAYSTPATTASPASSVAETETDPVRPDLSMSRDQQNQFWNKIKWHNDQKNEKRDARIKKNIVIASPIARSARTAISAKFPRLPWASPFVRSMSLGSSLKHVQEATEHAQKGQSENKGKGKAREEGEDEDAGLQEAIRRSLQNKDKGEGRQNDHERVHRDTVRSGKVKESILEKERRLEQEQMERELANEIMRREEETEEEEEDWDDEEEDDDESSGDDDESSEDEDEEDGGEDGHGKGSDDEEKDKRAESEVENQA